MHLHFEPQNPAYAVSMKRLAGLRCSWKTLAKYFMNADVWSKGKEEEALSNACRNAGDGVTTSRKYL
jgi:hypothetical protein